MRVQQSFTNPYSRLQQKKYGYQHPQKPWLDRHGPKLVSAMMALSVLCVVGGCIMLFFLKVAE